MSSIDDRKRQAAIRTFFEKVLLPLAEQMKREGRAFFPLAPDPQAATYYLLRAKRTMSPTDFTALGPSGTDEVESLLRTLWLDQGHPELAQQAGEISRLAGQLRAVETQNSEVSELIYVMF